MKTKLYREMNFEESLKTPQLKSLNKRLKKNTNYNRYNRRQVQKAAIWSLVNNFTTKTS